MISYHNGDLLESECEIICHQVNLQGVMGGGIALQIAKKYPLCELEYKLLCLSNNAFNLLGEVYIFDIDTNYKIANCFSQKINYDTSYESVRSCFNKILRYAKENNLKTIGVPFGYGCGIANGDWNKVEQIFKELFENEENIDFQIWKL